MKKAKSLVVLMTLGATLLTGAISPQLASANSSDDYYTENAEAIQELRDAGATDEDIEVLRQNVEQEELYLEGPADAEAQADMDEIQYLVDNDKETVKEEIPKALDPNYGYTESTGEFKAYSTALGTKGDIIVSYEVNSGSSAIGVGHAAIVGINNSRTVESYLKSWSPINKDGVQYYGNSWKSKKKVYGLWVKNASGAKYTAAANYAQGKIGKPYNLNFFNKTTEDKFYCSQLVWRAWQKQGYDLDAVANGVITPMELVNSSKTTTFYHRKS